MRVVGCAVMSRPPDTSNVSEGIVTAPPAPLNGSGSGPVGPPWRRLDLDVVDPDLADVGAGDPEVEGQAVASGSVLMICST